MWPFKKKVELGPNLRFAKACAEAAEEERLRQANEKLAEEFREAISKAEYFANELIEKGFDVWLAQGSIRTRRLVHFGQNFDITIRRTEVTKL